jgi:predicted enzyme related to lactoylglutathione lyase
MPSNILCWTDIPVTDLPRAINFYSAVLDAPVELQSHDGWEFAVLPHAHDQASGCLTVAKDNKPSSSGPLIYLSVEGRLDAAAETVTAAGGKLVEPKTAIGPFGYRVLLTDTEGNRIALHSFKP